MSGSVNKVILIGNLGKDPEIRHLESGSVVAYFHIATSEVFTDRNSGEKKEIKDWHDIVVWKGLATLAEKYLRKGTKVYVEGKLKRRSWIDKDGQTRYTVEIIANDLTILSQPEPREKETFKAPYSNEGTPLPPVPLIDLEPDSQDELPF
jgi:single-strand DNA-binding protein